MKNHPDPKRLLKKSHPQQLQTHNVPTDDVKILTVQIREEIYDSLMSCGFFPEDQKGCLKWTRGRGELLYIDQHILKESKMRWKNLAMVWINYKKVYDIVAQSGIIDCLKMYKLSGEVIKFIENTLENRRVELIAGDKS